MEHDIAQPKLHIEKILMQTRYIASSGGIAICKIAQESRGGSGFKDIDLALIKVEDSEQKIDEINLSDCIPLPKNLDPQLAILTPPLAYSLWIWDVLGLEMGEAAVFSTGNAFSQIIGQIAIWRGGVPVVQLGNNTSNDDFSNDVNIIDIKNPQEAIIKLERTLKNKPGTAIVELSGRPEIIDIILETLPAWGRVMFAATKGKPLTIDFYNNIHRKGAKIFNCIFDPVDIFSPSNDSNFKEIINNAFKILSNSKMAEVCSKLIKTTN